MNLQLNKDWASNIAASYEHSGQNFQEGKFQAVNSTLQFMASPLWHANMQLAGHYPAPRQSSMIGSLWPIWSTSCPAFNTHSLISCNYFTGCRYTSFICTNDPENLQFLNGKPTFVGNPNFQLFSSCDFVTNNNTLSSQTSLCDDPTLNMLVYMHNTGNPGSHQLFTNVGNLGASTLSCSNSTASMA